ncbi:hypothetical protein ABZ876_09910 [Streptomyces sp. NPDC046931]|uniref:hypothetical protein n=1 Tax=Streptomyces sp. NPDC046931 TaxID=3154806 RepID=UPI0033FAC144
MHDFIERIGGWTPVAIFGGAVIISAGILGVHAAASGTGSSSGLDSTSVEYQQGWNDAVAEKLINNDIRMSKVICAVPALYDSAAKADAEYPNYSELHFSGWSYSDHQRKEWAHGCLDALRNLTDYKVPQQSWEG